jgi:ubiquinone/menaquinone biosynthesis C-methylase UbiE
MFTHMVPVKKLSHKARNTDYELLVYQVEETGEYRIYVAKGGFGVGDIFTASQEVVRDAKSTTGIDIVESLISTAIDDINRNEFRLY